MQIETVMFLIAGLGAFLIGFKVLSDNLTKFANKAMRNMFNKISANRFAGVAVGAGSTALIQSSAATTVMLIGFVNAGLITLSQAVPIIMGANIGTTITALILSLDAIDVPLYAMVLSLIGIFCSMVAKKERTKTLFLAIAGIGLVFFGLKTMSTQMRVVADQPVVKDVLGSISFPLLLFLLGVVFTIVMQSSTAVTGILLSMAGAGLVIGNGGNSIYFVILGTNVGTCLTAIISSIGASTNAKRTAVIHLLFNLIGSAIFLIILWCWQGFGDFWDGLIESKKMEIAIFHMSFNVLCTAIFLPFTELFVKSAKMIIPDKASKKPSTGGRLDDRLLRAPGVAVGAVVNETALMAEHAIKALTDSFNGFLDKDQSVEESVREKITETVNINSEITVFLVKLSSTNVALSSERIISAVYSALPDIQRIAELADNITGYTDQYIKKELMFSESVITELKEMFATITALYEKAFESFGLDPNYDFDKAEQLEDKIDNYKKTLLDGHMKRLNDGTCRPESSGVFINLVNNLERAGDHLYFIAQSFSKASKETDA